jgi:hypothetical protein
MRYVSHPLHRSVHLRLSLLNIYRLSLQSGVSFALWVGLAPMQAEERANMIEYVKEEVLQCYFIICVISLDASIDGTPFSPIAILIFCSIFAASEIVGHMVLDRLALMMHLQPSGWLGSFVAYSRLLLVLIATFAVMMGMFVLLVFHSAQDMSPATLFEIGALFVRTTKR